MPPHMDVTTTSGLAATVFVMCEVKSVVLGNGAHTSDTISDPGSSFSRAASKCSWNQRPNA